MCSCLPACDRVRYEVDLNTIVLRDMDRELILMDVHFQYMNMMKYRTDVAFGFLDLLVGYGGVAGLFLGSSLLSLVEILYYLTVGLVFHSVRFKGSSIIGNNVSRVSGRKSIHLKPNQQINNYF